MTKFGLFVILVEFVGFIFYAEEKIYLGCAWCLLWIVGIYCYEKISYKRYLQLLCLLHALEWCCVVCANDRNAASGVSEKDV